MQPESQKGNFDMNKYVTINTHKFDRNKRVTRRSLETALPLNGMTMRVAASALFRIGMRREF